MSTPEPEMASEGNSADVVQSHLEVADAAPEVDERHVSLEPNIESPESDMIGTQLPEPFDDTESLFQDDITDATTPPDASEDKLADIQSNAEAIATNATVAIPMAEVHVKQQSDVPESSKASVSAVTAIPISRPKSGPGSGRGRKKKPDEFDELTVEEGDEGLLKLFPQAFGPSSLAPIPKKVRAPGRHVELPPVEVKAPRAQTPKLETPVMEPVVEYPPAPIRSGREESLPLFVRGTTATPAPEEPSTTPIMQAPVVPSMNINTPTANVQQNVQNGDTESGPSTEMAPPPTPSSAKKPARPSLSMFEKIKLHQQKIRALAQNDSQNDKQTAPAVQTPARQASESPSGAPPLHELLGSVLSGNGSASASNEAPDEEDQKALAEYLKKKKHYDELRNKNGGTLSFKHDIEWMKIQGEEEARQRKRQREIQQEREESELPDTALFPVDFDLTKDRNSVDTEETSDSDSAEDSYRSSQKRPHPDFPRKEPRLSFRQAELDSMNVALEATADAPKKKRKKSDDTQDSSTQATASSSSSKGKGKEKAKAPKAKASSSKKKSSSSSSKVTKSKKPKRTAKQKYETNRQIKQVTSLMKNDVFRDQAAEDAAEQPTFTATRKDHALKELIASVPLESRDAARSDKAALLAATRDLDGRGAAKPKDGLWLIKGMKTALKPYQLMGTAFMRRRENATEEPRGGLMADQMGLGKTLMMLANIVNGRAPRTHPQKTTLLVASPNLLTQWGNEIRTHVDAGQKLSVLRYSYGSRIVSNCGGQILANHDIILTTYNEVMRSYPKNDPPEELQTAEEKMEWWKREYEEHRGVLHRMMFYRVVLDEAQVIKNHTSRTSIACRALMAEHKWALSGTPILNSLTELYPYFKFLGVPFTGSFKIFKHNYCDPGDSDNTERLLVRLSQFMIRRNHSDILFGAPILKLPKCREYTMWCDFNDIERNIYDIVHHRFILTINRMAQRGDLDKSYGNVLVMLLRLRQMTAHILMLQFVMKDLLQLEDIERIKEVIKDAAVDESTRGRHIIAVRKQLEEFTSNQKAAKEAGTDQPEEQGSATEEGEEDAYERLMNMSTPGNASGSGATEDEDLSENRRATNKDSGKRFGKDYDFSPYLKSLMSGTSFSKMRDEVICTTCKKPEKNPWITSCHHLYCMKCLENMQIEAAENEQDHAMCRDCGKAFYHSHPVNADSDDDSQAGPSGPTTRSRAKKAPEPEKEDLRGDWLNLGGQNVLPSAKTIAIKAQVLNWVQENPNVKIIIYTQFLAMIRILGKVCQEEGWGYCEYHGKQSFVARDKTIAEFADDPSKRILLASLRCGGLGLNLTMASRVIVIDPWWNKAAEQQAFCRVFRIGQVDTTFMTRLCINNTVDHRLIEMQKRKQEEIDEVMEDGGTTLKKLSMRDLMRLFGPVEEDSEGKPFILVSDPVQRGGLQVRMGQEVFEDDE